MARGQSIIDSLPAGLAADNDAIDGLFKVADRVAANCAASNGLVLEVIAYAINMVSDEFDSNDSEAISAMRDRIDSLRAGSR